MEAMEEMALYLELMWAHLCMLIIRDILVLGERTTQGLGDTTLAAEAKYPINFTQSGKIFLLSLHYNESNSFLFVNATKVYQFKAKNSEKNIMHCL